MNYEQMNNNKVILSGTIVTEPTFSHSVYGEGFYEMKLNVKRLSEESDEIPVTLSDRIIADNNLNVGSKLSLAGQFRSYNKVVDNKSKLMLTVFVRELLLEEEVENSNLIELSGFICKQPVYRTTPFKREIADILLAVNRAYNKSDYIPCIAWGRNARYANILKIGEKVGVSGRIQSRIYQKKNEEGQLENKVAYEVSICKLISEDHSNTQIKHIENYDNFTMFDGNII